MPIIGRRLDRRKAPGQRTRAVALALAIASSIPALAQRRAEGPPAHVVDLTHTLDEAFPYIPVPGITFPFTLVPIATLEANGVAANRWDIHEHIGTQIDAPNHFVRGGAGLDALPVETLVAPLAVIDISARAQRDPDAAVTVADIHDWERRHGPLPDGAAVFMYSGWEARLRTPGAFVNADSRGTMHFPGFSAEAVAFLAAERRVSGLGVDTISLDPGRDREFRAHKAWLGARRWAVEVVANLREVPPSGATVVVGAPKVAGATGGPVRLLAMWERASAAGASPALQGFWEHERCQVQERDGRRAGSRSLFAFFDREWGIALTLYADAACRVPVLTATLRGTYEATAASARVPGAADMTFRFSRKALAVYDAALLERLNAGACGERRWVAGVEQDVTATGCLSVEPLSACAQEYDLAKVEGDRLYLGERPPEGTNLCTEARRASRLRAEPLRRR